MDDLAAVTLEHFLAHVGTQFDVEAGDGAVVPLTLTLVKALPTDPAHRGRTPFSLEFTGPADPAYEQQTLPLVHPAFGRLQIFVVPLARDAAGTRYQAIFT